MVAFADVKRVEISELIPTVHAQLDRLCQLTKAFREVQEALEGDEFGKGRRFVGKALSLRYHVHKFRDTHPAAVTAFNEYLERLKRAYFGEWRLLLLMRFLDPSVQFQEGQTCSDAEFQAVKMLLANLVHAQTQADTATHPGEPRDKMERGSDNFTTYVPTGRPDPVSPADQIDLCSRICGSCQHAKDFWEHSPPEMRQLSLVAFRVLGLLTTSASVKRSFSVARAISGDDQLAHKQSTVSSRVPICANWSIAEPLLREMLATPVRLRSLMACEAGSEAGAWRLAVHPDDQQNLKNYVGVWSRRRRQRRSQ
jgi:hypothetical protein